MILRDSCMIVDWFDKHDLAWSPAPASGGPERAADVYPQTGTHRTG